MYLVISVKMDSLSANTSGIDPFVANQSAILPFLGGYSSKYMHVRIYIRGWSGEGLKLEVET